MFGEADQLFYYFCKNGHFSVQILMIRSRVCWNLLECYDPHRNVVHVKKIICRMSCGCCRFQPLAAKQTNEQHLENQNYCETEQLNQSAAVFDRFFTGALHNEQLQLICIV